METLFTGKQTFASIYIYSYTSRYVRFDFTLHYFSNFCLANVEREINYLTMSVSAMGPKKDTTSFTTL